MAHAIWIRITSIAWSHLENCFYWVKFTLLFLALTL